MRVFALPDVAGNGFVKRQVAQGCTCCAGLVVRRLIQNRPGILPSIEPAPPYAAGAPGSSSGGSRFTSILGLTSVLNARGICARIHVEPVLDERENLGAAFVALGKLVFRILGQRLHPLADGPLRVAEAFQDGVHLRVQPLEFAAAHRVDFVGRHGGGRRRLQRPAVEFFAARPRPHAGIDWSRRSAGLELRDLSIERRARRLAWQCRVRARPSCPGCSSSAVRWTRPANRLRARFSPTDEFARAPCRGERLVAPVRAARGLHAAASLRPAALRTIAAWRDTPRHRLRSRSDDRRRAKRGTSRYAPTFWITAYGVLRQPPTVDVAVRQRQAFEGRSVGAADHLDARASGIRKAVDIESVGAFEVGAHLGGNALPTFFRAVKELRTQRGARAGVDAELCRAFGREPKVTLARSRRAVRARPRRWWWPRVQPVPAPACIRARVAGQQPRPVPRSLRDGLLVNRTWADCTVPSNRC